MIVLIGAFLAVADGIYGLHHLPGPSSSRRKRQLRAALQT